MKYTMGELADQLIAVALQRVFQVRHGWTKREFAVPAQSGTYLAVYDCTRITLALREVILAYYDAETHEWSAREYAEPTKWITHWMSLPEAPRREA